MERQKLRLLKKVAAQIPMNLTSLILKATFWLEGTFNLVFSKKVRIRHLNLLIVFKKNNNIGQYNNRT